MLRTANVLSLAGLACLAISMTAVVFLVLDVIYGGGLVVAATVAIAALFVALWYALPLWRRARTG